MTKKLGVFVGERQNWTFFDHIYADLARLYETEVFREAVVQTPIFRERLSRMRTTRRMTRILRESDAAFFEWASQLLVQASHLPPTCPLITRLHSFELTVWAPRVNWANVDHVILVSKTIEARFLAAYPHCRGKTTVVYNGIPVAAYAGRDQGNFDFSIGLLANFHPIKRIYEAVFLVHKLRQRGYAPHLHLAGRRWPDGFFDTYYLAVERAVEKLGLTDCVTFHGYVEDTAGWLRGIDIYLSNSYWEGQSVALLESLAAGCYSLAHFWDGADEVLPAEQIYGSDDEALELISAFAEMPVKERRARRAAMQAIAAERFTEERQCAAIRDVIAAVLS